MAVTAGNLQGKIALVTGASRGIGRAIALRLARDGLDVAVVYRTQREAAVQVRDAIAALGRRAVALACDVSVGPQVRDMYAQVSEQLGTVTVLVNNAGITRPEPLEEITEASWDELIDTNLKSVFLVTQAALPAMRAVRFGRIINLGSVAAQLGGVVGPHYAASKAGIVGLTHAYAAQLADEGITVNTIAPALVQTAMTDGNPLATPARIPVGRLGHVTEVADVASMLAHNGYVTGQTINVNGGWYMSS